MLTRQLNRWFLCLLAWAEEINWKVTSNQMLLKASDNDENQDPPPPMDKQLVEEQELIRKCQRGAGTGNRVLKAKETEFQESETVNNGTARERLMVSGTFTGLGNHHNFLFITQKETHQQLPSSFIANPSPPPFSLRQPLIYILSL